MQTTVADAFFNMTSFWKMRRENDVPRRRQLYRQQMERLTQDLDASLRTLTRAELDAVALRSKGDLSRKWNAELTSGQVTSPEVALIQSAFTKVRAPYNLTVYAGLKAPDPQALPGPVVQAGFTSTSLSPIVALSFADVDHQYHGQAIEWDAGNATQLAVIRIPAGHPVLVVHGAFTEFEVLLPPKLNATRLWVETPNGTDPRSVAMYQLQ
ncbi:hypothetical protein [Deinococcus soli (ex Cha et al. 2016)]|uniref:Uncharacterized protein n=2 Tax=Deinococcus soli (ex Cha et al. 2016) TaxID=1309411 RepID=A0AAE3XDH9_9DEIO|nr:hypothetical protein [Deinococcus soli (ex Cha et al. 2016)]MDR6218888.1 hypothetical protein [Deinococcus soli (ex Cha et al. 2016)]MDR6328685.1 hypothetical protein [Deinococcus soli (ex Cha et al. 2016)]MDR6751828.1 hypothetical protein [Deinococcus soli (ex Cha et al. 2016)]